MLVHPCAGCKQVSVYWFLNLCFIVAFVCVYDVSTSEGIDNYLHQTNQLIKQEQNFFICLLDTIKE